MDKKYLEKEVEFISQAFGSNIALLCKNNFATIMIEKPMLVYEILSKNFASNEELYDDIMSDKECFKSFVFESISQENKNENNYQLKDYTNINGKLFKVTQTIGDNNFCLGNRVVSSGSEIYFYENMNVLIENYLFNTRHNKVTDYKNDIDAFVESIGQIKKINILQDKYKKDISISLYDGDDVFIKVEHGKITELHNPNVRIVKDDFLMYNKSLKVLRLENVKEIGNNFLKNNTNLAEFFAPKLEKMGNHSLVWNRNLKTFNMPNLKEVGISCLLLNKDLKKFNAPNLEKSNGFMLEINEGVEINAPKLKEIGENFNKRIRNVVERNLSM